MNAGQPKGSEQTPQVPNTGSPSEPRCSDHECAHCGEHQHEDAATHGEYCCGNFRCDHVDGSLENATAGAGDEAVDESAWGETAPVVDEAAPDEITELASACIRFVHDALGVELDFTPETLPLLDHYLICARSDLAEKPEVRELVFRAAGAYFGELLRRRLNGFWLLPTPDVHTWRVCGRHVLLSVNPVGVVAEAVAESESSDGPSGQLRLARADQAEVAQRLADAPPLPEDQFFLTSTRLEVIDVVVEHLRARMEQNDQGNMEFDPDDYGTDLKPYGHA